MPDPTKPLNKGNTTSVNNLGIIPDNYLEDIIAKDLLIQENNKLASQWATNHPNNVVQRPVNNDKIDYPSTDRRSSNYVGNPNWSFAAPNMKGKQRADAEAYHGDIIGGELLGLGTERLASKAYSAYKKGKNSYNALSNGPKLKSFTEEVKGELYRGRQNRKDIKEGNEWLKNWIEHPVTQNKIAADRERIMKKTAAIANSNDNLSTRQKNKYFKKLDEEFRGAAEFIPNSKEYPLSRQFLGLFDPNVSGMHVGNAGISNKHLFGKSDAILEKYDKDWKHKFDYDESWISRRLNNTEKVETTVHEGTHDWVNNFLLQKSGKYNEVLNSVPSSSREKYFEWKNFRNKGIDPSAGMSSNDAYLGYLTNPTEVHARIMEMRNRFNLSPDRKITPTNVNAMLKYYDPDGFSRVFDSNPIKRNEQIAKLFNNLYTVGASTVVAGGALSQQDSTRKFSDGGVNSINPSQDRIVDSFNSIENNDIGFLFNKKFGI